MNSNVYINRHNYKLFDNNIVVPADAEAHVDTVINCTPMQEPYEKFCILKLSNNKNDIKIKEFYLTRIFKNDRGLHMTAMATAPLVYFIVYKHHYGAADILSAGLHAGTVMAETLNLGLDISIVGCTCPLSSKDQKKSRNLLIARFNNFDITKYQEFPSLCLCIGKGIEPVPGIRLQSYKLSDESVVPYINSFSERKPNILLT